MFEIKNVGRIKKGDWKLPNFSQFQEDSIISKEIQQTLTTCSNSYPTWIQFKDAVLIHKKD